MKLGIQGFTTNDLVEVLERFPALWGVYQCIDSRVSHFWALQIADFPRGCAKKLALLLLRVSSLELTNEIW